MFRNVNMKKKNSLKSHANDVYLKRSMRYSLLKEEKYSLKEPCMQMTKRAT